MKQTVENLPDITITGELNTLFAMNHQCLRLMDAIMEQNGGIINGIIMKVIALFDGEEITGEPGGFRLCCPYHNDTQLMAKVDMIEQKFSCLGCGTEKELHVVVDDLEALYAEKINREAQNNVIVK